MTEVMVDDVTQDTKTAIGITQTSNLADFKR